MLHQQDPEQAQDRFAVGKDAEDLLATADFFIEPLMPVARDGDTTHPLIDALGITVWASCSPPITAKSLGRRRTEDGD